MLLGIGIGTGLVVTTILLFVGLSPQFGGKATEAQKATYELSDNYRDGRFVNSNAVQLDMSFGDMLKSIVGFLRSQPNTTPKENLPVRKMDSMAIASYQGLKLIHSKIRNRLV